MVEQASKAARELAARRKRVTRNCEHCGKETTGISTRRYCSAACRSAAARERSPQTGGHSDPLIDRLNEFAARIAANLPGGKFPDTAAEIIEQAREERVAEL